MTTSSSSGATPAPSLQEPDFSALYRTASAVSQSGQRSTKRLVKGELWALVLAGGAGVESLRVGTAGLDVLAAASGVLFLASLGCLLLRLWRRPDEAWYGGRAAAESVKTLAWRYAVAGDPFPITSTDRVAARTYLARLEEILAELPRVELGRTAPDDSELTPAMKALRAAPFPARRAAYERDRVVDQIRWYSTRADQHDARARRWLGVTALASVLGVVAAAVKMVGVIDFDLLGVAAAAASAAIAWNQLNQYRALVTAYRLAARELTIIRGQIEYVDEAEWAAFVSDAEDAVSREHTLWLARRGHPGPNRR